MRKGNGKKMKKYDLIIFDCDGTLVDSETLINLIFAEVMQAGGYNKYTYDYCIDNFSGYSYPDVVSTIVREYPDIPVKNLEEKFIKAINDRIPKELKAMPKTHEVLERLFDYKKCVASNGQKVIVQHSLQLTGLIKYFNHEHIYTYESVTCGKPSPDLFLYAAAKFNTKPSKCLVVEDSVVGITGAKSAGMDVVVYQPSNINPVLNQIKSLNPKAIISDFEQLLALV